MAGTEVRFDTVNGSPRFTEDHFKMGGRSLADLGN
jgi:hypothetical protein